MTSEKIALRMFLRPGCATEYKKRHDEIWPKLVRLLKSAGLSDYSIYLDAEHHTLVAVLRRTPSPITDSLSQHPLMQRWWAHMADLMRTHPDGSPVVEPLPCMFHMD